MTEIIVETYTKNEELEAKVKELQQEVEVLRANKNQKEYSKDVLRNMAAMRSHKLNKIE